MLTIQEISSEKLRLNLYDRDLILLLASKKQYSAHSFSGLDKGKPLYIFFNIQACFFFGTSSDFMKNFTIFVKSHYLQNLEGTNLVNIGMGNEEHGHFKFIFCPELFAIKFIKPLPL